VIRDAWRLAHGLHAELIAVSIQPEGYLAFTSKLIRFLKFRSDASRQYELAQQRIEDLGAEVIRVSSRDIAKTLVQVAKEHQATQIVLGQPARSWWEEILRGSIVNRLLRLSTAMDIHLVPRESEE
jgi:two-component system sensor histidine kinase KdpD